MITGGEQNEWLLQWLGLNLEMQLQGAMEQQGNDLAGIVATGVVNGIVMLISRG